MYIGGVDIFGLDLEIKDGDSNEVCTAKYMIQTYIALDGDSQEMSLREIDKANLAYEGAICAVEVLRVRDELKIKPTSNNPTGTVRQCDRRDLHEPHDYQADFGAYFDVHCPGNRGTER